MALGQLDADTLTKLRATLTDPVAWSHGWQKRKLRRYQQGPARSVAASVAARDGHHHVWYFSRQSGKDETLAQLIAYLLTRYQQTGGSVIVIAPTQIPQAAISRDRTLAALRQAHPTRRITRIRDGYIISVGQASASFLSIDGNIRGQTASLLLVANEAQDITTTRWDPVAGPMTASTNAPTLFVGTAWKADSLIGRERRAAERAQLSDGQQRLWNVTWSQVAEELPAYGDHVRQRIAELGDHHPFIRSEYELEEIDEGQRLFGAARLAQLEGSHQRLRRPADGALYAGLIDVAGSDETTYNPELVQAQSESRRDSSALTIVQVLTDGPRPRYQVVDRRLWTNRPLSELNDQIADLCRMWHLRYLVIDATGIGHGLYSSLRKSTPTGTTVEPFTFTAKSKSDLGWSLISMIDTGRLKDYAHDQEPETTAVYEQLSRIEHEVMSGPGRLLRWSVPAGKGHDDLVMSLALIAHLDTLSLTSRVARGTGP